MIPLDSPRWSELEHAYGAADDIPPLLRQLESFPVSCGDSEPWFTLWSSLCHQDDVYPASFAAVPHIIRILATAPTRASFSFFQLPTCIEIARARDGFPIPDDLRQPYFDSLQQFPSLVAASATRPWDENLMCCGLSAIAAAKGFPSVANALQELTPKTAERFMDWFYEQ
ncbi:hypothetical protein [Chthoniobacter flavus]|uniref:hypothetical protein n=1 Tax=Chthoniobacter flavus TaxID=191863 RepID=UPI0005B2AED3|nr:hypothetical protein [Chthoniobacter flavus]